MVTHVAAQEVMVIQHQVWYVSVKDKASQFAAKVSSVAYSVFATCRYYVTYPIKVVARSFVLMATNLNMSDPQFVQWHQVHRDSLPEGTQRTLAMNDSIQLDGFCLPQPNKEDGCSRYLVFFCGNNMTAETALPHCKILQEKINAEVTCYSYQGTGLSGGRILAEDDFLSFGRTVINSVVPKLTPNSQLILHGWSLGGSLATILTKEYENRAFKVFLVNDRSFTKISDVISNLAQCPKQLRPMINWLVARAGWSLDASKAVLSLRSKILVISCVFDQIIRHRAQFHRTFADIKPENVTLYQMPLYTMHGSPLIEEPIVQLYNNFLAVTR